MLAVLTCLGAKVQQNIKTEWLDYKITVKTLPGCQRGWTPKDENVGSDMRTFSNYCETEKSEIIIFFPQIYLNLFESAESN